ncbi:MAG: helix-turn-helix transcriptional regulator [Sedimentisphaerales bacterium]|nr:helix-turn-helix transcriptional regulator [Sedimentisphaerales bacterium]
MAEVIKKLNFLLTIVGLCNIMIHMDIIKKAILAKMKQRGWTCYRLSKELEGKLPQRTVYSYLSGERDISAERVSIILKVLGLKIKR